MKSILSITLLLISISSYAQIKIDKKDFHHLIAMGRLYSINPNASGKQFAKTIDSLRTPKLSHIADALIATSKRDKSILEKNILQRPDDEELVFWYVIREIHYNRTNEKQLKRPDSIVAKDFLSRKIDSRWLLDNYYYRIHGGLSFLFNDADLSNYNINIDSLGFKDETEKAIFFMSMMNALISPRVKVLNMMKNNKKILQFADKMPLFNGRKYFYYKNFDYPDFEYIGYDKTEWYNKRNIGDFFNVLLIHFLATADLRSKKEAQEIYFNSILREPKYFEFTSSKDELQSLYDKSK